MEDSDRLLLARVTIDLVFDEEHGELVLVDSDDDTAPTCIQAIGMLRMAEDMYLSGFMYEDADDETD